MNLLLKTAKIGIESIVIEVVLRTHAEQRIKIHGRERENGN